MSQLFAAHLQKKNPNVSISGYYDSEQQLWMTNSQPQGADLHAYRTVSPTSTSPFKTNSYCNKTVWVETGVWYVTLDKTTVLQVDYTQTDYSDSGVSYD